MPEVQPTKSAIGGRSNDVPESTPTPEGGLEDAASLPKLDRRPPSVAFDGEENRVACTVEPPVQDQGCDRSFVVDFRSKMLPLSVSNSTLILQALKACDIRFVSALQDASLVNLISMAERDPELTVVRTVNHGESIAISAGAQIAGLKSAVLMPNRDLLGSVAGIVSFAEPYRIPLLMLVLCGDFSARDPHETDIDITAQILRACRIPFVRVGPPNFVALQIAQAAEVAFLENTPVGLLLTQDLAVRAQPWLAI